MFENLFDNLLVTGILVGLVILIYCRMKNKSITDVIKEFKEALASPQETYQPQ